MSDKKEFKKKYNQKLQDLQIELVKPKIGSLKMGRK